MQAASGIERASFRVTFQYHCGTKSPLQSEQTSLNYGVIGFSARLAVFKRSTRLVGPSPWINGLLAVYPEGLVIFPNTGVTVQSDRAVRDDRATRTVRTTKSDGVLKCDTIAFATSKPVWKRCRLQDGAAVLRPLPECLSIQ